MKNKGIKKNLKVLLSIALLLLLFCMAAIILPLFTNNTATKTLVDICPDLESDGLIAKVWWINARIKTPEGIETTGIEAQNIKKALGLLEISEAPVSDDLSPDRDKTISVAFERMRSDYPTNNFSEIVYFNKDFTEVWIDNEGVLTCTYKVMSPEKARKITEVNNGNFAESQTVYDICPDLTGDKKYKHQTLSTRIHRCFESSSEYCGMLINDIQDIRISSEPISDLLYDSGGAFNIIEFSYNWANDYYSPRYKYEFCFNRDYSEMWLVIDDKGGPKYKVYEPQKLADMCSNVNYNINDLYGIDKEKLNELYTYNEEIKQVKLKIDADLLPKLGDKSKFKEKSNVHTNYWLDKQEGCAYSGDNTKIKLKSIGYGNDESEFITLSFCIENNIPDHGEVLYGRYMNHDNTKELYSLVENLEVQCGDVTYTDAIKVSMLNWNEIDIHMKKEVYSKLSGEAEILYPLVSVNLKKK